MSDKIDKATMPRMFNLANGSQWIVYRLKDDSFRSKTLSLVVIKHFFILFLIAVKNVIYFQKALEINLLKNCSYKYTNYR
ncbi:MAG: hypothetical protein ACI9DJ_001019 [Algoriphagus sp.]|jgi:hypothetical protein